MRGEVSRVPAVRMPRAPALHGVAFLPERSNEHVHAAARSTDADTGAGAVPGVRGVAVVGRGGRGGTEATGRGGESANCIGKTGTSRLSNRRR